jgi:hypothetical protein
MPLVSDEQIRQAKEVDILAYLRAHEPESLRKSKGGNDEYYLAEHDSLKISNGKFHWFSRGVGGCSALDFLIKVRGMGFIDAVHHLTGDSLEYKATSHPPPPKQDKPPKPFMMPPKNANNDRVYAYLRRRGIDGDIIKRCIDGGILYENTRGNCIFVGFNGNKPRFACERGTKDYLKKDISGSDKRFSFIMPPINPESRDLACFEAPVDCLSHAGIHKMDSGKWDGYRLSLGGIGSIALISFLERNPRIENVRLCLDNDDTGRGAAKRIVSDLLGDNRFSRLKIAIAPPPIGKDYNDSLQAIIQLQKHRSRQDRSKEAVDFI